MLEATITAYKLATRRFASAFDLGNNRVQISTEIELLSSVLVEDYGLTWEELEAIELEVLATC